MEPIARFATSTSWSARRVGSGSRYQIVYHRHGRAAAGRDSCRLDAMSQI